MYFFINSTDPSCAILSKKLSSSTPVECLKTIAVRECNRYPWFDWEMRIFGSSTHRLERKHSKDKKPESRRVWNIVHKSNRKLSYEKASSYQQRSTMCKKFSSTVWNINTVLGESVKPSLAFFAAKYHDTFKSIKSMITGVRERLQAH